MVFAYFESIPLDFQINLLSREQDQTKQVLITFKLHSTGDKSYKPLETMSEYL
jgi:hypothetical protein